MIKNTFEKKLNIGFDIDTYPIRKIQSEYTELSKGRAFSVDISIIDTQIINFLKTLNLSIRHAEAFYTPPGRFTSIHVDGNYFDNHVKLNWVYGAPGAKMHWYVLKENVEPEIYNTVIDTKALFFKKENVDLVWSADIGLPSLVNVGGPHNIENNTTEGRWCLSLVLWDDVKNQRLDWYDSIKIFAQFFI